MKNKIVDYPVRPAFVFGGSSCVVHRHAPKPPHKNKKDSLLAMRKKYVVKNLQSLMLPGHHGIFLPQF